MAPKKLFPLKAVYSYYYPEVRKIVDKLTAIYPHNIFLQSIEPGLDDYHFPVIEAYLDHFHDQLPDLPAFPHRYVTSGASEAIFHLLAHIAASPKKEPLYVLDGEYEGYTGYGENLGLSFTVAAETDSLLTLPPGIVFLSNPSARDGNIISNEEVLAICEAGHKIIYDITYVGLTDPFRFDLAHENIVAVIASLSKPFGIYYHRLGFAFSRLEMKTLAVNKWFKNIFSLLLAKNILAEIGEKELVDRYRPIQSEAVARMAEDFGFVPKKSQVVLLAYAEKNSLTKNQGRNWEKYNRRHNYRFCLTPYFLAKERKGGDENGGKL